SSAVCLFLSATYSPRLLSDVAAPRGPQGESRSRGDDGGDALTDRVPDDPGAVGRVVEETHAQTPHRIEAGRGQEVIPHRLPHHRRGHTPGQPRPRGEREDRPADRPPVTAQEVPRPEVVRPH